MARRSNDLYIGANYLNTEGREIKHPALIKVFATINLNKISDDPMQFIGMDLETQAEDGTLKLLGLWDGDKYYHYYNESFISILFNWVKFASKDNKNLVYWNRLDPFVLYKQFLLYVNDTKKIKLSMEKFSKVGGDWDKESGTWTITPIVEIKMQGGLYFGIMNVIRSNIQFFYRRENDTKISTVWAYDVAQLYQEGLETTAMGKFNKKTKKYEFPRLTWYTKVDKTAHIVDWNRFDTDTSYRENIVLKSNMYDSKAVYELAHQIQQEFFEAFKFYPRTLISQGSIARAGIVATLKNMHGDDRGKILDDIRSIGIINYLDNWQDTYGEDVVKDLLCLMFEAYSGGQIEAYMYGYTEEAFTSDLTQAYPYHIENLYDLRGSTITHGKGEPPHIPYSYCLLRGDVDIPLDVDYHPLTIKHPIHTHRETNIRAVGNYRASYTLEERDFLISLGATFSHEEWYNIETKGKLSPLAKVCKIFTDLRAKLKPFGKDYIAKISSASLYGILFEAVNTWVEDYVNKVDVEVREDKFFKTILGQYKNKINWDGFESEFKYIFGKDYSKIKSMWYNKDGLQADDLKVQLEEIGVTLKHHHPADIVKEINDLYRQPITYKQNINSKELGVFKDGYRGGEFLNPLYATIITSRTRIQVSQASNIIKSKGGKPIQVMTDSLFWEGTADMLPPELIKPVKTVGYFEPVQKVKDFVCLGSGRYGYVSEEGYVQAKKRGLNAVDIHDPDGIIKEDFNWLNALKIMKRTQELKIKIKVRALVSVGMVLNNHSYTYKDLGRIVEEFRDVDVIVGKSKRLYDDDIKDPSLLYEGLIPTDPIFLGYGMDGTKTLNDQTLPHLRELLMKQHMTTTKEKRKKYRKTATTNYYNKNGDKIKSYRKQNYEYLKQYGYDSKTRNKMQSWSLENIQLQLIKDGKI